MTNMQLNCSIHYNCSEFSFSISTCLSSAWQDVFPALVVNHISLLHALSVPDILNNDVLISMSGQDYLLQMFQWFFWASGNLGVGGVWSFIWLCKESSRMVQDSCPQSHQASSTPYALIIHVVPIKVLLFLSGGFAVSLTACQINVVVCSLSVSISLFSFLPDPSQPCSMSH